MPHRPSLGPLLLFGQVLPVAAVGVGLFGVLRLTRQFPAAASSPTLLVPFLLPVLALALEAGALVAFSVSVVRACHSLPLRPFAARAKALLGVTALLAATLGLAEALPRGTERPGAFANELVESARQSCKGIGTVPVPLLGLSVRCDRGLRIEGPMPGVPSVQLAMQALAFSDDLRRVQITGLDLTARRSLSVRLRAGSARISGLAPWTRSAQLSPLVRCAILSAIGAGLALAAGLWWRSAPAANGETKGWRRWIPGVLGTLPGLAAASVVIALDQEQARALSYGGALAAALVVLLALLVVRWRAPQIFNSFRSF